MTFEEELKSEKLNDLDDFHAQNHPYRKTQLILKRLPSNVFGSKETNSETIDQDYVRRWLEYLKIYKKYAKEGGRLYKEIVRSLELISQVMAEEKMEVKEAE